MILYLEVICCGSSVVERKSEKFEGVGAIPTRSTKVINIDKFELSRYDYSRSMRGLKRKEKSAVISLRKKGKTYREIREIYDIPKGTLSDWCRHVKIPVAIQREKQKRTNKRWREKNTIFVQQRIEKARAIRETWQNNAKKEIQKIKREDLKLIGSVLYWAEGSFKNRNAVRFANADPEIIQLIMKFFRIICKIRNEKIKARIHLYPKTNQSKATDYWMQITSLPKSNFYKPQVQISRASRQKRRSNTLPFGTLHLTICNTETVCKIKGWSKGIVEKS